MRVEPAPPPSSTTNALERGIAELTEELRLQRARQRDLTGPRVLAIALQLAVLMAAVMGLLQVAESDAFMRWFLGAILLQATAIAALLIDRR
jgi:hypothetical protein